MLLPCDSCDRHVRVSESACPFCGAPRRAVAAPPGALDLPTRLSRSAIVALAAAALAGPTACGGQSAAEPPPDTPVAPMYGAPAPVEDPPLPGGQDPEQTSPGPAAPTDPKPAPPVAAYGGPPRP